MKYFLLQIIFIVCVQTYGLCQDNQTRAVSLYPFENKLGYRSNLSKNYFTDIKAGLTFSTLPFLQFELSRNKRFVRKDIFNTYIGVGVTFDSYVPGVQLPIGFEIMPFKQLNNFCIITEVNPKITFGPANFLNTNLQGHLGMAYFFR
jgi:hypothetical protein